LSERSLAWTGRKRKMTRIVFDLTKIVRIGQGSSANQRTSLARKGDDISDVIENIMDLCISFGRSASWHNNCITKCENQLRK
jgi:hypothetical protein